MVRSGKRESYLHIFTENLREHWLNRTQIARLSVADLKSTYHGAALGWSWAVIKPVFTIFIYWFAIDIGLRSGKQFRRSVERRNSVKLGRPNLPCEDAGRGHRNPDTQG